MHPVSTSATARPEPLRGVIIEDETDGITRIAFVDLSGEVVRRAIIRSDLLTDALLIEFHDWMDFHNATLGRPSLRIVR